MKTIESGTIDAVAYRPLKVYAFDPTRGRTLGNYMTVPVRYEKLKPGPVGQYLAVIDYDATNGCYYPPVDLDDPAVLLNGGLGPSESDPRFHQQMVYAIVSETIERFELALGRTIRWNFSRWRGKDEPDQDRLRIFPHAMQEANAYYSRDLRALVFGYFPASETDAGANLPGQTVFTCLSHDIIAHETTHALVDSQRGFFTQPTNVDVPAFHEAFADIVALLQHFTFKDALLETIEQTGGRIYQAMVPPQSEPGKEGPVIQTQLAADNPLVGLAKQFGEAMGMRKALRSALGTPPKSADIDKFFEPHARGSILVAAVFDAFFSIYVRRTQDLMRIARAGGIQTSANGLHPDLANRLAQEATKTAEHFLNICVRALDYCPPVDIRFGDFLRAMITADRDLVHDDEHGYRAALIDAFRSRGIVPENVSSYSEESLLWCPPEVIRRHQELPRCEGLEFDVFKRDYKERRKEQHEKNGALLHEFAVKNAQLLGLSPNLKVWARNFHLVHRVGPDGQQNFDVVAELMQHRDVPLDLADSSSGTFKFWGGTTLILSWNGKIRYAVQKSIGEEKDDDKNERLRRQRDYYDQQQAYLGMAPYSGSTGASSHFSFNMIHRGY